MTNHRHGEEGAIRKKNKLSHSHRCGKICKKEWWQSQATHTRGRSSIPYMCFCIYKNIRTYLHINMYIYKALSTSISVHTHTTHYDTHTYIHTYIRSYIHTYIHTYMHSYVHTYINKKYIYIYTYTHTYIYTHEPDFFVEVLPRAP